MSSKAVTLYFVERDRGKLRLSSVEARETPQTYRIDSTDTCGAFGYRTLIRKTDWQLKVCLTPEEALQDCIERNKEFEREYLENADKARRTAFEAQALLDQLKES